MVFGSVVANDPSTNDAASAGVRRLAASDARVIFTIGRNSSMRCCCRRMFHTEAATLEAASAKSVPPRFLHDVAHVAK